MSKAELMTMEHKLKNLYLANEFEEIYKIGLSVQSTLAVSK